MFLGSDSLEFCVFLLVLFCGPPTGTHSRNSDYRSPGSHLCFLSQVPRTCPTSPQHLIKRPGPPDIHSHTHSLTHPTCFMECLGSPHLLPSSLPKFWTERLMSCRTYPADLPRHSKKAKSHPLLLQGSLSCRCHCPLGPPRPKPGSCP